jgi:uncharacterized membrane protein
MLELLRGATLIAATITMGLMAGLFAAFSYAVMPGLRRTEDRTFVDAMQRVNAAILNGWFAVGFAGAVLFTALSAALHLGSSGRSVLPWIVAALVLYATVLTVTFVVNVPLNNALAAAGAVDGITDFAVVRERFEARWARWNVARAVLSTGALGCLALALVRYGQITV